MFMYIWMFFDGNAHSGYFVIYDGHGGRGAVDFVVKALYENFKAFYIKVESIAAVWKEFYKIMDV